MFLSKINSRFLCHRSIYPNLSTLNCTKSFTAFFTDEAVQVSYDTVTDVKPKSPSFATMLRKSSFIQMGSHENVNVVGKVFQVQDDNLYVDFGGKFHCVCSLANHVKSSDERAKYRRGTYVVIKLLSFELSARFLGATQDTTLLEADAKLIGLYKEKRDKEKTRPVDENENFIQILSQLKEEQEKTLNSASIKAAQNIKSENIATNEKK